MQFEMNHNVSEQVCKVTFLHPEKVKKESWKVLDEIFQRLGANQCDNGSYLFPSFIRASMLDEIIYNTCYVCGGLMKDGQAIQNGVVKVYEEYERSICYTPYVDPTNHSLIKVRKCISCGHSHT